MIKTMTKDTKLYLTYDNANSGFVLDEKYLSEDTLMNIVNWCMQMFDKKTKNCKNCKK